MTVDYGAITLILGFMGWSEQEDGMVCHPQPIGGGNRQPPHNSIMSALLFHETQVILQRLGHEQPLCAVVLQHPPPHLIP